MIQEFKSEDGVFYRLFRADMTKAEADRIAKGVPKTHTTKTHEYEICGEKKVALYISK